VAIQGETRQNCRPWRVLGRPSGLLGARPPASKAVVASSKAAQGTTAAGKGVGADRPGCSSPSSRCPAARAAPLLHRFPLALSLSPQPRPSPRAGRVPLAPPTVRSGAESSRSPRSAFARPACRQAGEGYDFHLRATLGTANWVRRVHLFDQRRPAFASLPRRGGTDGNPCSARRRLPLRPLTPYRLQVGDPAG